MIRAASILTIGLGVLGIPAPAQAQRAVSPPRTHTVVVGGHAVRAQSYGLDARRTGEPVVVFEAGATNSLEVWDAIAPQVAESAVVVTYDRAGLGASAWDGVRPTPQHVAARSATLLREIGAPPPYVLVGYSWGGTLARYFAGLHPDAVAGIVYVDPGPVVTQTLAGELELLEESGAGTAGRDSLRAVADRAMQQMPEAMSAYDQAAHFEVDLRHPIRLLSEWVLPSPSGMLLVSRAVTHAIPLEDPDLVTWVVRRVLSLARGQEANGSGGGSPPDTVFVAAPTGDSETDGPNVQAAFDAVQPGGTVQFAQGMYMLGAGARLTVPDVTVLGHPDGTVLRGCDPEAFDVAFDEVDRIVYGCTGFHIQAERQTIRGLTFEYTWHGIVVGPYPTSQEEARALEEAGVLGPPDYAAGGQRIEGNTFRAAPNGLRVLGTGDDLSVVRDNDFIDVFHAIGIYGAPLHFLGNRVAVEDPTRVPFSRHPGSAILVSPGNTNCAGHVVAGNTIQGHPDAIYVSSYRGGTCRSAEIRDNTIRVSRVKVPEAWAGYEPTADDSTMVGAPITLMKSDVLIPGAPDTAKAILEQIVVKDNRIIGAEGLGILVQGASHSRIEGNTISGIERRSPFPGITWDGAEALWEEANGSGIWISSGSNANEVAGNTFEDVAGAAVVVEGDSNRVTLSSPADTVRDLGTGNRVDRFWLQDIRESDAAGAGRMLSRAMPQTSQSQRQAIMEWRPAFLGGDRPSIALQIRPNGRPRPPTPCTSRSRPPNGQSTRSTRSPETRRKCASSRGPTSTPKSSSSAVDATTRSFAGIGVPAR